MDFELIKDNWTYEDGVNFNRELEKLKNKNKVDFFKKNINTKMPLLAIKTPILKAIAKEILKGNFLSFLELNLNKYYDNTIINGTIISNIKDFDLFSKYLQSYALIIDNWASCDLLEFNATNYGVENYFSLAKKLTKSDKVFARRVGVVMLFKLIKYDKFIFEIFEILNGFYNEQEYYVNMALAWLVCECFIKREEQTKEFLKDNNLNKFVINKAIQKCRDSFRVSDKNKEFLLQFKV